MDGHKENPAARLGVQGVKQSSFNSNHYTRPPTKIVRVLSAFINGWVGHRFQAEIELHDHAINLTVSTIQNKHHVRIDRETITVRGYQGAKTTVAKYWLPEDQIDKANALLLHFQQRRGAIQ